MSLDKAFSAILDEKLKAITDRLDSIEDYIRSQKKEYLNTDEVKERFGWSYYKLAKYRKQYNIDYTPGSPDTYNLQDLLRVQRIKSTGSDEF